MCLACTTSTRLESCAPVTSSVVWFRFSLVSRERNFTQFCNTHTHTRLHIYMVSSVFPCFRLSVSVSYHK